MRKLCNVLILIVVLVFANASLAQQKTFAKIQTDSVL
jgi:hypothetical protein